MVGSVATHDLDDLLPKVTPIVGIRWYSWSNDWMDCVVLVRQEDRSRAIDAITAGINQFWEESDLCYGDCIEAALKEKNIPYSIEYMQQGVYRDDNAWDKHIDDLRSIGIKVLNI